MTAQIRDAVRPFTCESLTALLPPTTRLLGLGEPTHRVEAFPELRNELFRHLVQHEGYRSIALETDCLAALVADAHVTRGEGDFEDAMKRGFSHDWDTIAANRDLVAWMRAYNQGRPPAGRLHLYGMDGPLEITGAASPRPALTALYDYLAAHLDLPWSRDELDELLRKDELWTNPAAMMDPAQSIGRTPDAEDLRLIADDLHTLLAANAPLLMDATSRDDWWRADLHARTLSGLLRYHAGMADPGPARMNTLLSLRDTMMASNLDAIVRREARRGPTLVFAHNGHLQRDRSSMRMRDLHTEWWSAGAIVSSHLGDRYAVVASNFGRRGSDVPGPDTLEGMLAGLPDDRVVADPARLAGVLDRTPVRRVPADHTYASLDPSALTRADALVFLKEIS
ncbi:erythromycin esterase family protein [Actinomadura rupiterrae]|uniref:erythromycin esterase family protein n=1 Tax=Actinomadura rupiterrae TaxID=559627 RepID=UPI0020A614BF|nr:erythromycin esterase family protein [Actinomadura rupiterrae]MCP2343243.1 erythromycin esterase-like protein [Actinomadura rupiterrae]